MTELKRTGRENLEAVNVGSCLSSLTTKEIFIIYNLAPYSLKISSNMPLDDSVCRGEFGYHMKNKPHKLLRGFKLAPERLLTKLSLNSKHTYLLIYL